MTHTSIIEATIAFGLIFLTVLVWKFFIAKTLDIRAARTIEAAFVLAGFGVNLFRYFFLEGLKPSAHDLYLIPGVGLMLLVAGFIASRKYTHSVGTRLTIGACWMFAWAVPATSLFLLCRLLQQDQMSGGALLFFYIVLAVAIFGFVFKDFKFTPEPH